MEVWDACRRKSRLRLFCVSVIADVMENSGSSGSVSMVIVMVVGAAGGWIWTFICNDIDVVFVGKRSCQDDKFYEAT